MKKMSAIFAFLCVFSAAAMAADVYSVNAVGYYTVPLATNGQFVMVGSSFDPVPGTNESRTILDIFGTNSGLRTSGSRTAVDRVYVWDIPTQRYLILAQTTNGNFASPTSGTLWGIPTNPVVPRGYGFFVQTISGSATPVTLTLAGQVPSGLTNVLTISGSAINSPFQMVMNPFPVATTLDFLINSNHGAVASDSRTACDKVYKWSKNSQRYEIYGLKAPSNRWFYSSSGSLWASNIPPVTVDVGEAFWYIGKTNFEWRAEKTNYYQWP